MLIAVMWGNTRHQLTEGALQRVHAAAVAAIMAHAHDDEIMRGNDHRALAARAVREVRRLRNGPAAVAVPPDQPPADRPLPRLRGHADEGRPAFGQQTLSLPHPVLDVELADA